MFRFKGLFISTEMNKDINSEDFDKQIVVFGNDNIVDKGIDNVLVIGNNFNVTESNKRYISEDVTRDDLIDLIESLCISINTNIKEKYYK